MLAEWYKKARFEEGQAKGRELERAEWVASMAKLEAWEARREEPGEGVESSASRGLFRQGNLRLVNVML